MCGLVEAGISETETVQGSTKMKFLPPINALIYYTYKMLKCTVKISHNCSYMFRSTWTIIREPCRTLPKLQFCGNSKYTTFLTYFYWLFPQNCNFGKVRRRFPDDGPSGPKHVGAIMRYFNGTF